MPQESKVKWAQLRVGMMAIAALAILGYLIVLLSGSHGFFKSKSDLLAFVGDSGDIAQGAPVRLNGIVVGKVKRVALSGSADPRRVVKIEMEVDSEFMTAIPVDSKGVSGLEPFKSGIAKYPVRLSTCKSLRASFTSIFRRRPSNLVEAG